MESGPLEGSQDIKWGSPDRFHNHDVISEVFGGLKYIR